MRFFFLLITFASPFIVFSTLGESINLPNQKVLNQFIAQQIEDSDRTNSQEETVLQSQSALIDSDQIESQDPARDTKPKKKVIKNLEYFLLAGFFVLLIALYFFVRKKK